MEAHVKISNTLSLKLEENGEKELFEKLAHMQEIFGHSTCGACGKSNIRYQVREVDGNKFYELVCNDCGAKLSFGQHKKGGTMFPKRKGDDDKYLPNKGWVKWDGKKKE